MWQNNGIDDGFGAGGGFDASNVGGTPGGSADKKKVANTVAHVNIKQIVESTEDELKIGNCEIGCVCLVGIVRKIDASSMKIVYTVEDNTGTITVLQWLNEDKPNEGGVPVVENTYCEVFGKIRVQNEKKFVLAFSVKAIVDLKAITVHRLAVVYSVLKLEQIAQQETEAFSTRQDSTSMSMMNTGATGMQFGGVSDSYGFNPQQLKVYRAIQQCRREGGASKDEIGSSLTVKIPPMELEKILDFLVSEGHIYTTMDENHFMATDFAV